MVCLQVSTPTKPNRFVHLGRAAVVSGRFLSALRLEMIVRKLVLMASVATLVVSLTSAGREVHATTWDPPLVGPDHLIDGTGPDLLTQLADEPIDPFEWDPLRLVGAEWVRTYTLGVDTLEVWVCEPGGVSLGATVAETAATMDAWVGAYYREISHGRYQPNFIEGGTVVVAESSMCMPAVEAAAVSHPAVSEGALVVVAGTGMGGYASFSRACSGEDCFFPANERIAAVGGGIVKVGPYGIPDASTTTHELGHMLMFPHSFTGVSGSEYDNPIDFMSGNLLVGGGASFFPYLTMAVNRYAAGWIDPDQVVVFDGLDGGRTVELVTYEHDGVQMVAVRGEVGEFLTIESRQQSPWDPIPVEYEGVAIHLVNQRPNGCPPTGYGWCFGIDRRHYQAAGSPYTTDHVLGVGERLQVGSFAVEVMARTESGYIVALKASNGTPVVGLVDPDQGLWRLFDDAGFEVSEFFFGNPGDYPIMGDWDCDGIETPGMYRQSDGYVYLRNSNTQGPADVRFFFGDPGDVPVAGDFNNDGCDTVSIYRPGSQTFFIISGGMKALLDDPEQLALLQEDHGRLETGIEEMLRWVTPIKNMNRTATREIELEGQVIPEGAQVLLFYPSANRDETVFDDPFRFDVLRSPNNHLAFGFGSHFCLGNALARLELRTMFEQLFTRLPDLRLADDAPLPVRAANFISGFEGMPVEFTPTSRLA